MDAPKLFIVAGPKGAGKNLFSAQLTESDFTVFDGDKHMTGILQKFPEIESEALLSYVDEQLLRCKRTVGKSVPNVLHSPHAASVCDSPQYSIKDKKQ